MPAGTHTYSYALLNETSGTAKLRRKLLRNIRKISVQLENMRDTISCIGAVETDN